MSSDKLCRNIESQAQTWIVHLSFLLNAKEAFENVGLFLFGNAHAEILHRGQNFLSCQNGPDNDNLGIGRVFDRVGQQVDEYLPKPVAVPKNRYCWPGLLY